MRVPRTASGELEFTRVFDAQRELVFACMIQPAHLTHFWGPDGTSAPEHRMLVEPWEGGRFETVMVNDTDGSEYPVRAIYLEVVEPERLVWEEAQSSMTVTATFIDLGGARTEVRIHQTNVPEGMRSPEAQAGFVTSLNRFAGYLDLLKEECTP
jgi:uncharacterized protein YndB with AHSA1/START domain